MKDYRFEFCPPGAEDYNRLRLDAGWGAMDEGRAGCSLGKSLFAVCVMKEGEVIGMARVVGDDGLCFYIQDVIVATPFQRRGLGTALMRHVMDYIGSRAVDRSFVGLMAAKDKEPFYRRFGFEDRPNERLGCGMTQAWKAPAAAPGGEEG